MRQHNLAAWLGLVVTLGALGGCANDIDPDSLVRELRILGVRVSSGDPAAGPTAAELQAQIVPGAGGFDLMFTTSSVTLSSLVGAPTGPGRRLAAPRPLQYDWYLCVGVRSLYSPGTLDPDCRKWGPEDPDPKTNRSLVYLNPAGALSADGSGALTLPTDVLKGTLLAFLQTALAGSGQGGGGSGGSGQMLPTRPLSILLPILLRVSAVGGSPADNRDSEVGYNYLRVVIAVPALGIALPPPNHNPVLDALLGSAQADGTLQPLAPCAGGTCTPYAVPRSQGTFLTGRVVAGTLETYDALDDSGRTGITETPRFSWFASDGDFSELRTGAAKPQTQWRNGDKYPAAAETTTVSLWLVVQDERGGTDWQQYALQLQ
jgi:hypothetical protein